jgi:hypothetical protein
LAIAVLFVITLILEGAIVGQPEQAAVIQLI